MKPRIIFLLLIFISASSHADEWESIIKTSDFEVLVNIDSYIMQEGYPSMTTQVKYKKQQLEKSQKPYWVKETAAQYNCAAHLIKPTKMILLDKKLKPVGKLSVTKQFSPIDNNTDAQVETLVCQVHKMVGGS